MSHKCIFIYTHTKGDDNDQEIMLILASKYWLLLVQISIVKTGGRSCTTKIDANCSISTNEKVPIGILGRLNKESKCNRIY